MIASRFRFISSLCLSGAIFVVAGAILGGCGGGNNGSGGNSPAPVTALRVACVGDSITFGFGSPQPYPSILSDLLGRPFKVSNFGVSGATILGGGSGAFRGKAAYAEALAFNPDIVVIELGTNDSDRSLDAALQAQFVSDYKDFVAAFARNAGALGRPKPRIFACTPPASYPTDALRNRVNRAIIAPLIEQAARESGVPTIDLFTPLSNQPRLFPDGVHPHLEGARKIAAVVAKAIKTPVTP